MLMVLWAIAPQATCPRPVAVRAPSSSLGGDMASRLLFRSVPLLVLAVVALGLLGTRSVAPPASGETPAEWTAGEAAGPVIVARATDRIPAAARPLAPAALAAAAAGLVAARAAVSVAPAAVSVARARSEALSTLRRRGPPAGRAR